MPVYAQYIYCTYDLVWTCVHVELMLQGGLFAKWLSVIFFFERGPLSVTNFYPLNDEICINWLSQEIEIFYIWYDCKDYNEGKKFYWFSKVQVLFCFSIVFWWTRGPFIVFILPCRPSEDSLQWSTIPDGSPSKDCQSTVGWGDCWIRTKVQVASWNPVRNFKFCRGIAKGFPLVPK
jgi:hypothetical protein